MRGGEREIEREREREREREIWRERNIEREGGERGCFNFDPGTQLGQAGSIGERSVNTVGNSSQVRLNPHFMATPPHACLCCHE